MEGPGTTTMTPLARDKIEKRESHTTFYHKAENLPLFGSLAPPVTAIVRRTPLARDKIEKRESHTTFYHKAENLPLFSTPAPPVTAIVRRKGP